MKLNKIETVIKAWMKSLFGHIVFGLLSVLPIENKVVFANFSGKCYGDSPRYISVALHKIAPKIPIIWLKHRGYEFEVPDYINVVTWPSFRMLKELATARVWVDSHTKPIYVQKRKGQYFIETWHGGLGIKKIEGDAMDSLSFTYVTNFLHNVKLVDVFLSNSTWISNIYRRSLHYNGKIIECGYPKNDIFFQDTKSIRNKVRKNLKLQKDSKIILYAPTFRDNEDFNWLDIDFGELKQGLDLHFKEEWTILIKLHPLMLKRQNDISKKMNDVLNVTQYPDTQELILASDMLLTDYSSCIFDFALMRKPGFLYASDYRSYLQDRGTYVDIRRDLPFPFADTTEKLIENIREYNDEQYQKKLELYFSSATVGLKETGTASDFVADLITKQMK